MFYILYPSQKCLRIVAEVRVNIYHCVFAPAAAAVLSLCSLVSGAAGAVWGGQCNHVCQIIAIFNPFLNFLFCFQIDTNNRYLQKHR